MKHYFTIISLLFLTISFSQTTTTEEEYRYLTEGYGKQIENGLDVYKEGYVLEDLFKSGEMSGYSFDYYSFKTAETKELKAILIVCQKLKKDKVRYLCIPFNNRELLGKFTGDYQTLGVSMKSMLEMVNIWVLSEFALQLEAPKTD